MLVFHRLTCWWWWSDRSYNLCWAPGRWPGERVLYVRYPGNHLFAAAELRLVVAPLVLMEHGAGHLGGWQLVRMGLMLAPRQGV
jgi:hypothetical protein